MSSMLTNFGPLSAIIFSPLLGIFILLFIPSTFPKVIRIMTLLFSIIIFAGLIGYGLNTHIFQLNSFRFQWQEFVRWVPGLGINYHVGIDGISLWLLMLTSLITIFAVGVAAVSEARMKLLMMSLLFLEMTLFGVFTSLDLILFFTFFDLSLIPIYFLISNWGGEKRSYASLKFFIYTFTGSIFMLVGMIALANLASQKSGYLSFNLLDIQAAVSSGALWKGGMHLQGWIFWAFAIAFMVKSPLFPFHTWLPVTYKQSPATFLVLSAVVLKMGSYGFLRFCMPLFPESFTAAVPILACLAVIGIVYGAIIAASQKDILGILAYSSIAQMGFVMLGIFSLNHTGMMGGVLQQVNHGLITGMLFLLMGFLMVRRKTTLLDQYGGLRSQMPIFAGVFLVALLAGMGLPGTNGFIGEFLALLGAFESGYSGAFRLNVWMIVIATTGVALSSVYLLRLYQGIFYGPRQSSVYHRLRDMSWVEIIASGGLIAIIFWIGLYPSFYFMPMEASIHGLRMMTVNTAGERPAWKDRSLDINRDGKIERFERSLKLLKTIVVEIPNTKKPTVGPLNTK